LTVTLLRVVDLRFDAVERSCGPLEELYCVNYGRHTALTCEYLTLAGRRGSVQVSWGPFRAVQRTCLLPICSPRCSPAGWNTAANSVHPEATALTGARHGR